MPVNCQEDVKDFVGFQKLVRASIYLSTRPLLHTDIDAINELRIIRSELLVSCLLDSDIITSVYDDALLRYGKAGTIYN